MNRRRESSVRNLQFLYTIFVALAFERIVTAVLEPEQSGALNPVRVVPLAVAFIVTVVPFYHGALKHLDDSYIENGAQRLRSSALLVDFVVLFLESALIYAIAIHIDRPVAFAWFLTALLAIDAIWGGFIRRYFTIRRQEQPEMMWAKINGIAIAWLVAVTILHILWLGSALLLTFILLANCVGRSLADYYFSWSFYFPDN